MPVYALLVWLVIGAVAGWLAQRILGKVGPYGMVGDIVVGLIGAIIGGYLLGLLGASGSGGILVSFLTALVGALLLIWILGKIVKR
jgi:uncharacterized membrane protein YeaQ/YmgE (transglycosylase-associated protein family)